MKFQCYVYLVRFPNTTFLKVKLGSLTNIYRMPLLCCNPAYLWRSRMYRIWGRFLLTSTTTHCVRASYETSQIKENLRLIRMSLCGLPALRTFLLSIHLQCFGGRMHLCRSIHNWVNRQEQWPGSDLPPNKKCIPRLLTPIMAGKNSPACPSLPPVTPTPSGRGSTPSSSRGWRKGCGSPVTASPHPIFHR